MTDSEFEYLKKKAEEFSKITGKKITISQALRILLFGKERVEND